MIGYWSSDVCCFVFSSRRRHTRLRRDWSSDVCSSDLVHDTPKEEPPDPGPPPAPSTYMGPELIAIIGDEAWFRGSGIGSGAVIRLRAGNEKDGLKVVSTTLPSMVTVEYRRGVYEIDLFVVEEPFFLEQAPPAPDTSFLKEVDDTNGDSSPS